MGTGCFREALAGKLLVLSMCRPWLPFRLSTCALGYGYGSAGGAGFPRKGEESEGRIHPDKMQAPRMLTSCAV